MPPETIDSKRIIDLLRLKKKASELAFRIEVVTDESIKNWYAVDISRPIRIFGIEVLTGKLPLDIVVKAINERDKK